MNNKLLLLALIVFSFACSEDDAIPTESEARRVSRIEVIRPFFTLPSILEYTYNENDDIDYIESGFGDDINRRYQFFYNENAQIDSIQSLTKFDEEFFTDVTYYYGYDQNFFFPTQVSTSGFNGSRAISFFNRYLYGTSPDPVEISLFTRDSTLLRVTEYRYGGVNNNLINIDDLPIMSSELFNPIFNRKRLISPEISDLIIPNSSSFLVFSERLITQIGEDDSDFQVIEAEDNIPISISIGGNIFNFEYLDE